MGFFYLNMVGIYKITNPKKNVYIGQSVDIERRFIDYKKSLKKSQIRLYNSIKKYGYENHVFEVIEECDISLLNEKERHWQDFYNVISKNGLNCRLTKTNDKSGRLSDETILKLKNRDTTYMIGNSFRTGIKHSDEIKNQIKNTLILNARSSNYKNAMTGMTGNKNPFFGKKHTKESLLKMSQSQKIISSKHLLKYNLYRSYLLLDTFTGIYYNSISEASEILNINKSTLKAMLSGKFKNKSNLIKV